MQGMQYFLDSSILVFGSAWICKLRGWILGRSWFLSSPILYHYDFYFLYNLLYLGIRIFQQLLKSVFVCLILLDHLQWQYHVWSELRHLRKTIVSSLPWWRRYPGLASLKSYEIETVASGTEHWKQTPDSSRVGWAAITPHVGLEVSLQVDFIQVNRLVAYNDGREARQIGIRECCRTQNRTFPTIWLLRRTSCPSFVAPSAVLPDSVGHAGLAISISV